MKKKTVHHRTHHRHATHSSSHKGQDYIVLVRGWMFVVAFALMLGIGAIVGTYLQTQIDQSTPTVAGASTEF